MNELSIKEIIITSVKTYKDRWKTLMLISFYSALITTSVGIIGIIANTLEFSAIQVLLSLLNMIVIIISVYFTSRLSVALIIATRASLSMEDVVVSKVYNEAKPLTWRYIGYTWLFGFIVIVPLMLVILGTNIGGFFNIILPIRLVLFVTGIIPTIYLFTVFSFSLQTAVIYPEESRIFTYSRKLVGGYFLKVLIVILIPLIVTSPIAASQFIFSTAQSSFIIQFGASLLRMIPSILITPFTMLLILETMKRLEEIKLKKI